jgi:uncharacterized OB-fold protein
MLLDHARLDALNTNGPSMTTERPNIQTREGQERLRELGIRPVPRPDEVSAPFWEAARRHELQLQRCARCREYVHPPEAACPHCASAELGWERVSGRGLVYSFIVDHRLMVPGFDEPYVVAQVTPREAGSDVVRLTANIRGCDIHDVYIGMPVEVFFEDVGDGVTLPQFRPAADADSAGGAA